MNNIVVTINGKDEVINSNISSYISGLQIKNERLEKKLKQAVKCLDLVFKNYDKFCKLYEQVMG